MITFYSEQQTLALVTRLTRTHLASLIEAEAVIPVHHKGAPAFRAEDIARLELLCDLSELYDMPPDALSLVVRLLDQLHATRRDLRTVLAALSDAPDDLRGRIVDLLSHGAPGSGGA
jgi:chaperone modulatory protein CbpM